MRTRMPLVAALLGVAVASGCTSATAGTPHAVSSQTSSTSDQPPGSGDDLPSNGAPKVDNPLDVSRFEEHPCEALTPADAETLNVPTPGKQADNGFGQSCDWINSKTRGALGVSFFSKVDSGLSSLYREAKSANWPLFERVADIEDHPAVVYSPSEAEPTIECSVAIGLTDRLAFTTNASLSDANIGKKNPCDAAAEAAGLLMRNMEAA
jgi:hypothetical protein